MTKVKSVITVLQYKSYLQLRITEFTGHKITMKMIKCQVKFTIQVFGQEKNNRIYVKLEPVLMEIWILIVNLSYLPHFVARQVDFIHKVGTDTLSLKSKTEVCK